MGRHKKSDIIPVASADSGEPVKSANKKTIRDALVEKARLESELLKQLQAYENEYGLSIAYIQLKRIQSVGKPQIIGHVNLYVRLGDGE